MVHFILGWSIFYLMGRFKISKHKKNTSIPTAPPPPRKKKSSKRQMMKIILIGRVFTNQSWHLEKYCDTYIYFMKLKSREYIVYRKQQYCSFWTVDTLGKWCESEAAPRYPRPCHGLMVSGLNPYFVSNPLYIFWRYIVMLISCDFQNIVEISLSHFFTISHDIYLISTHTESPYRWLKVLLVKLF